MKQKILQVQKDHKGVYLDPRTKMFMVLTISTIMLSSGETGLMRFVKPLLAALPFLLLAGKEKEKALLYAISYTVSLLVVIYFLNTTQGLIHFILTALCGFITRFIPGIMAGYYMVTTMTVSEFTASMERMHVTEKLTIPLSVMFRFFPTVGEEYASIKDAMEMRGILFGGKHPFKILEYRMVPLLSSCVKIADELSAAALTRGLGSPIKRTNICQIGFKILDMGIWLLCMISIICFFIYKAELINLV